MRVAAVAVLLLTQQIGTVVGAPPHRFGRHPITTLNGHPALMYQPSGFHHSSRKIGTASIFADSNSWKTMLLPLEKPTSAAAR
jgi:hypothetical protein